MGAMMGEGNRCKDCKALGVCLRRSQKGAIYKSAWKPTACAPHLQQQCFCTIRLVIVNIRVLIPSCPASFSAIT